MASTSSKRAKTYGRENKSLVSTGAQAFNLLLAQNKALRILSEKCANEPKFASRKFAKQPKFEIKQLPAKIKTFLSDESSLHVNHNDTFDKVLRGPCPKPGLETSSFTAPRLRPQSKLGPSEVQKAAEEWFNMPTLSGEAITNSLEVEKLKITDSLLKKSDSSRRLRSHKSCLESSPPVSNTKKSLRSYSASKSKGTVKNNCSTKLFSNSVRESILVHSSTPMVKQKRQCLVGQAISPIKRQEEMYKSIVESLEEINSWSSAVPDFLEARPKRKRKKRDNLEQFKVLNKQLEGQESLIKIEELNDSKCKVTIKSITEEEFDSFQKEMINAQSLARARLMDKIDNEIQTENKTFTFLLDEFESFCDKYCKEMSCHKTFFDKFKSINFVTHRKHKLSQSFNGYAPSQNNPIFKDLIVLLSNNSSLAKINSILTKSISQSNSICKPLTVNLSRLSVNKLNGLSKDRSKRERSRSRISYKLSTSSFKNKSKYHSKLSLKRLSRNKSKTSLRSRSSRNNISNKRRLRSRSIYLPESSDQENKKVGKDLQTSSHSLQAKVLGYSSGPLFNSTTFNSRRSGTFDRSNANSSISKSAPDISQDSCEFNDKILILSKEFKKPRQNDSNQLNDKSQFFVRNDVANVEKSTANNKRCIIIDLSNCITSCSFNKSIKTINSISNDNVQIIEDSHSVEIIDDTREITSGSASSSIEIIEESLEIASEAASKRISLGAGKLWRRTLLKHKRASLLTQDLCENKCRRNSNRQTLLPCSTILKTEKLKKSLSEETGKNTVLKYCNQNMPEPFERVFPETLLKRCKKIGEGVYGEVFLNPKKNGKSTVLKVIPIEGDKLVNGEPQKKFHEIVSEIAISSQLSNLRKNGTNKTSSFSEVTQIRCVTGKYPQLLLDHWFNFKDEKGTENDTPDFFDESQHYIVIELANGGENLEAFEFKNALEAFSMFKQVSYALAVAEEQYQFEHRDLHWGNVLLRRVDPKTKVTFKYKGKTIKFATNGVEVTIIDFTLSRITHEDSTIFADLGNDPDLFSAYGDYQFDIYRLMKEKNKNNWEEFTPYTNLLWLHYILRKAVEKNGLRYKNIKSKVHEKHIDMLKNYEESILGFNSTREFVEETF